MPFLGRCHSWRSSRLVSEHESVKSTAYMSCVRLLDRCYSIISPDRVLLEWSRKESRYSGKRVSNFVLLPARHIGTLVSRTSLRHNSRQECQSWNPTTPRTYAQTYLMDHMLGSEFWKEDPRDQTVPNSSVPGSEGVSPIIYRAF